MSDKWFSVFLAIVLLLFAGIGVVLLLWPSKFLRRFQNPLQPDTPDLSLLFRVGANFVVDDDL
jgi:hypothetical protein